MALALIVKRTLGQQAPRNFYNNAFKVDTKRTFTQVLNGLKKEPKVNSEIGFKFSKRSMSSDHGKLWTIERILSLGLLPLVPLAIMTPNAIFDDLLATTMVVHFHWGLEACVVDYVRPIILGPVVPKVTLALLYLISVSTLGGLLYYNHHSLGIGNTVRKIWKN